MIMPKRAVFLIFLLCWFFCWPLKEVSSQINLDKAANFAKSLIDNREYSRALIELERISFINPSYFNPFQFKITIDYLNFQCKHYNNIVLLKTQDNDKNYNKNYTEDYDKIFAIDSAITLKNYKNAGIIIDNISNKDSQKKEFSEMLEKRLLFCDLMRSFPEKNIGNINYIDVSKDIYNTYNSLYNEIDSEMLAALFGIIPGGGYAYAGDISTGLVAFAVVTACAGLSYMSIRSGMKPMGIMFALAGTFFYGGSIYGGYRTVLRNNEAVVNRTYTELSEKLRFHEDREYIFKNHGLFK
jgi:hypothetical protein